MIGVMLAAALAAQAFPGAEPRSGQWVVIDVHRVVAPNTTPGQCFVQGQVRQVVRGRVYRQGQQLAISLACRQEPASLLTPLQAPRRPVRPPITVRRLEAARQALAHLDGQGRVVDNEYFPAEPQPLTPIPR